MEQQHDSADALVEELATKDLHSDADVRSAVLALMQSHYPSGMDRTRITVEARAALIEAVSHNVQMNGNAEAVSAGIQSFRLLPSEYS